MRQLIAFDTSDNLAFLKTAISNVLSWKPHKLPDINSVHLTYLSYAYPNGNCANDTCEDTECNCWIITGKDQDSNDFGMAV